MTEEEKIKQKVLLDRLFKVAFLIQSSVNYIELNGHMSAAIDNIGMDIDEMTEIVEELKSFNTKYPNLNN